MHKKSKQTNKKNLDKKRLTLFLAPFLQNTGGRAIDCEQLVFFSAQRSLNGGFFYFFFFRGNHSGGEKLETAFDISKLQISHISVFRKQSGAA